MANYVITGASGHIGNNLVRYINRMEPDAAITVLTRRLIETELEGINCHQVVGTLSDEEYLRRYVTRGSIVVHLAGLIDLTDTRWEETYRLNVQTANLLCDVCRTQEVSRYIYVGSVDAIPRTSDSVIVEPISYDPNSVEGHYGRSKAMATQYVLDAMAAHSDFSAAIVLPSAVVGPHDYKPSAVGGIIRGVLAGRPEFGIAGGYNFVFVEDVCAAIFTLCHSRRRDQYILSGDNVSVEELYGQINKRMGYRRHPLILPLPLVRLLSPFIPVLNPITLKALQESHDYCYDKAVRDLDYAPTSFSQALELTLEWFKNPAKRH